MGQVQSQQRVSPQQLRRLRTLHESLVTDFGTALSTLLHIPVEASLADVDQHTYGQFISSLESPACFYLLKADVLDDRPMPDIEPAILHPMIDRLLGGSGEDQLPPDRPLTEIELCVAARIVRLFLHECHNAWKPVLDLRLDVLQTESNPRLLRVLPADEMIVLIGIELAIGRRPGMVRLCLPCGMVERLGDRLLDKSELPSNDPVSDSLAQVRVMLAETQITRDDLTDLRVGDIITTETGVGSPATVAIAGTARFRAKPGVYQGRKAVVIAEKIEEPTRTVQEIPPPVESQPE